MPIDIRGPAGTSVDPGPVAGYAWPQAVVSGESFSLHLSSRYGYASVEIARIGKNRDVVWRKTDVAVDDCDVPVSVTEDGCGWSEALRINTDDWPSGYYDIDVSSPDGSEHSPAFVVVRAPQKNRNRIILVLSTNTWNAYNDVYSGENLYTRKVMASFTRPMSPGFLRKPYGPGRRVASVGLVDPSRVVHRGYKAVNHLSDWCGSAGWPSWEEPFVLWAERNGYGLDYAINADVENPDLLDGYRLLLSVGHDEYWSKPMRDSVENFIGAGGNVAFLSGNTSFWQVRIEGDGERMIGYKDQFELDPLYGTEREGEVTTMWSDRIIGRPENLMTGVTFTRGGYHRIGLKSPAGAGGYTVHRPGHWLFKDTGLEYGDLLGAGSTTVGYECDGCDFIYRDGLPYPTGLDGTPENFEILATAPAALYDRRTAVRLIPAGVASEIEQVASRVLGSADSEACAKLAHGQAVLGTYNRGGTVVTTGCTDWSHGLDGSSPQVEAITRNIMNSLG